MMAKDVAVRVAVNGVKRRVNSPPHKEEPASQAGPRGAGGRD